MLPGVCSFSEDGCEREQPARELLDVCLSHLPCELVGVTWTVWVTSQRMLDLVCCKKREVVSGALFSVFAFTNKKWMYGTDASEWWHDSPKPSSLVPEPRPHFQPGIPLHRPFKQTFNACCWWLHRFWVPSPRWPLVSFSWPRPAFPYLNRSCSKLSSLKRF